MSGRATLATARLRLATPATRISVARTSPARLGPPVCTRLELDPGAVGAEVADWGGADLPLAAPGLMDVAADGEPRPLLLDRRQQGRAAEVGVVAGAVAVALGWRVQDQHRALGAGGEHAAGLVVVEVEAPVPGGDWDPGAEAEELNPADAGAF